MNQSVLYTMMVVLALIMAVLPFGVFMGLGTAIGVPSTDIRLLVVYVLGALVISYLLSLAAFSVIQKTSCGQVKNMKQVAINSSISLAIQGVTLALTVFLPSLRGIVSGLLPPDLDPAILDSVAYSYYSFWAALFGTAIGGTLSGVC
jgi:hypothetical protein